MQTLNKPPEVDEPSVATEAPRRRPFLWIALGLALVLIVGGIAYAIGTTQSTTKTTVQRVNVPAAPTPAAAAPKCIPGAAAGSCNTDEAAEALIKDKPLDAATRAAVAAQLVTARATAMKYPTVADARRANMILAGGFSPQTGAHFINIAGAIGKFDPSVPGSLIYDGTSPTSKIIGLMYLGGDINPPEGFAGPNDHWHRHSNTCVVFGGPKGIVVPFAADSSVTKAQCDAEHGTFMRRTTWMVHAWVVPGWESPSGVFSHENTNVLCKNGTVKTDAKGFCQGT